MKKLLLPLLTLLLVLTSCSSVEYTVTFHTDGGTEIEPLVLEENSALELPTDPEKTGYLFGGWFTDDSFTEYYKQIDSMYQDVDLYAKFTPIQTVLYFNYGDKFLGGIYVDYDQEIIADEVVPNINGYTFNGWYNEPSLTTKVDTITGTLESQTFYADLTKDPVTIEEETDLDVTTLPYYGYLKDTNPVVTITVKDIGTMELQLFPDVAPNSVDNFINYVQSNAYTNSTFHRIIEDFMIQGGMVETTNCAISGEFTSNGFTNDLLHYRGVLSMARTSVMDSATSQFFIVHKDSTHLDGEYASFGGLTSGFNILDYLAGVGTLSDDSPIEDIIIESVTVDLKGYTTKDPVCAN